MNDWISRIVSVCVLLGTGFLAGSLFVEKQYGKVMGFPYTSSERLQWEVLATGFAAIAGGLLAYLGATKTHERTIKQALIAYRLKVIEATNIVYIHKDPNGIMLESIEAMVKEIDTGRYQTMRVEMVQDAAAKLLTELEMPPPEIINDELNKLVLNLQVYAKAMKYELIAHGVGMTKLFIAIESLRSYLDDKCK